MSLQELQRAQHLLDRYLDPFRKPLGPWKFERENRDSCRDHQQARAGEDKQCDADAEEQKANDCDHDPPHLRMGALM